MNNRLSKFFSLAEQTSEKLDSTLSVAKYAAQVRLRDDFKGDKKSLYVLSLDGENKVINANLVHGGEYGAHRKNLLHLAVMDGASKMVLLQNNPTNSVNFTKREKDLAASLKEFALYYNVELVDYVLVSNTTGDFFSFDELGVL